MSTSGAELLVPGTRTITFSTVPDQPPHIEDSAPRRRWTSVGSPSALARARMYWRTRACAGEPAGCGARATTLSSSSARPAEKAFCGAPAGTGSGGMAGSAATHAMATRATVSPRRATHEAATVRFTVVLLVVLIAPTVAHGSPHDVRRLPLI